MSIIFLQLSFGFCKLLYSEVICILFLLFSFLWFFFLMQKRTFNKKNCMLNIFTVLGKLFWLVIYHFFVLYSTFIRHHKRGIFILCRYMLSNFCTIQCSLSLSFVFLSLYTCVMIVGGDSLVLSIYVCIYFITIIHSMYLEGTITKIFNFWHMAL